MKRFETKRVRVASSQAVGELESQGLMLPDRPDFEQPVIPTDLTTLDDPHMMQLFAELTAWTDYLMGQVACAEIDERRSLRQASKVESQVMNVLAMADTKKTVTQLKAELDLDDGVDQAREEAAHATAYRKLLAALAESMERDSALISRELTRRTIPANQRASRW